MIDEPRDFAILNKFPQLYWNILEPILAHSNDEFIEKKGFYQIKTLVYRSKNTNCLFRRLDEMMLKATEQDLLAKKSRQRVWRLPKKTPVISKFMAAPKGLPIDFYDCKWYQNLFPSQQQSILNRTSLAFLPDARQSLLPKPQRHPDEKLADSTFTKKYWEAVVEPYGQLDGDALDDEGSEAGQEGDKYKEGEGIDLTGPIPDASSGDKYYEEGDAGHLYENDEDDDTNEEDEEETDGSDKEDEDYQVPHGAEKIDEDCVMDEIPEAKEDW